MSYIGAKVKEDVVIEVSDRIERWLPDSENIVAFFNVSHHHPLTDMLVITNRRLLSVYYNGLNHNKGFPTEVVANDISDVTFTRLTNTLIIILRDGTKKKIGLVQKEEAETVIKLIKNLSNASTLLNLNELEKAKAAADKQEFEVKLSSSKRHAAPDQIDKNELREHVSRQKPSRYSAVIERTEDAFIIIGKVNSASLREIRSNCRSGETPKYILGDGINGVLAIFEDRCIVVKKGLGTSFMSGSLGGGRAATFMYQDITGIEYNSGIMTGVLEILTASYTGKTTNSPWAFGNDRSAHELSNTLPWGKMFYNKVRPQVEWLKQRVSDVKSYNDQTIYPQASSDIATELSKLANLHAQGILTDKEFEVAKQRLIGKI